MIEYHRRLPLICGVVAGPLFTAVHLVEGATRAHYDPLRHPVSSLALGDSGWTQSAAFLAAGLLTLAFAAELRRHASCADGRPGTSRSAGPWFAYRPHRPRRTSRSAAGPLLLGAWAVGLLGAGTFVADPVSGYPEGTPDRLLDATAHGVLHDLFSFGGFAALTTACFVFARTGPRGWAIYSAAGGVAFAVAMVLSSRAFGQDESLAGVGGLLQRLALAIGWAWQTSLAVRLLRARSAGGAAGPGAAASTRESGRHRG